MVREIREIGRILISLVLLGLTVVLYYWGFSAPDVALKVGMTNTASVILGALIAYWFPPRR